MCGATRPSKAKIRGCLSLLQSWAQFRFLFLRPQVDHPYTFPLITRWNHLASYARLPASLEDIRLLLDQQSEAQFQWTPYEDPAIRVVIPNEYFQNPNAWHVKVALVNYATVEMHQSDRVLRQFGFRQPIPVAPELLSPEERQRQLRVQRERRVPLNPRRRDDDAGPSTRPRQSPGPSSAPIQSPDPATVPTQSPDPAVQPMITTAQPFHMMPGAYPNPFMYPSPYIYFLFLVLWQVRVNGPVHLHFRLH
ncbi:hypothetical protein Goshw_001606 [Gossypium schwendimanii]|uniref:Aminotransferase-like plant mobile domain-containing protein n=1 Tax=Gossypium schwendimanii TaxID=34291 RepID=A0A7J9N064_GOSSC|nr:hypothetical protein [Gossypium schwendimanii]